VNLDSIRNDGHRFIFVVGVIEDAEITHTQLPRRDQILIERFAVRGLLVWLMRQLFDDRVQNNSLVSLSRRPDLPGSVR
jgi:hypothetical protein